MVTVGLLVHLEAQPGKEADVASFLEQGLALVEEEPGTVAWFAFRIGPVSFGIFDAFPGDAERESHLAGHLATALAERSPELFARAPIIEQVDVLAAKVPTSER
jgi:quinol monooxygenase YgiN